VRAAFEDAAILHHKNLLGAANGGKTVRDDERGAAAHQVAQAFLNERLRFGIKAGGGFVEYQDARIGQDGAGDGNALLLSAGKLHAAFADDGAVFFCRTFPRIQSTRAMRQAARISSSVALGRAYATFSRIEPSKRNVSCRTTPNCVR